MPLPWTLDPGPWTLEALAVFMLSPCKHLTMFKQAHGNLLRCKETPESGRQFRGHVCPRLLCS